MNACHVLFKTNRFNLSRVGEHFINPCCFGEDLAAWLRSKLAEKGVEAGPPGQEDWGWYLKATSGTDSYFLGMNGNSEENSTNLDEGEWRIIVEKRRTIWQRVRGKGKIASDDGMVMFIEEILGGDSGFKDIHREKV